MNILSRLFAISTISFTVSGVTALAETGIVSDPIQVVVAPEKPLQRVWRDIKPLAKPKALCPQWWDTAIRAGWQPNQLKTLDYIINRESRCQQTAHNTTLNADRSTDMGLTQINDRSWCKSNRYNPAGYLQSLGLIKYCKDLFDPYLNLTAAKAIYDYAEKTSGNGFSPWGE